jgi:hypothetical protein
LEIGEFVNWKNISEKWGKMGGFLSKIAVFFFFQQRLYFEDFRRFTTEENGATL